MPEKPEDPREKLRILKTQIDDLLNSEALNDIFDLLDVDKKSIVQRFNKRSMDGNAVREVQTLPPLTVSESVRNDLFPCFKELGFIDINRPLNKTPDRILILGGSLKACFDRTAAAAGMISDRTLSIDGLSCYRPINPVERVAASFSSACETEFGAMSEAFIRFFGTDSCRWKEDFHGDRNLNRISCIRTLNGVSENHIFRIFAAPSEEPGLRRADTGDTLVHYLQSASPGPDETLLGVTGNRYCNRQFLQLAFVTMSLWKKGHPVPVRIDVTGCNSDDRTDTVETYDPGHYLQELIALLDWADRLQQL